MPKENNLITSHVVRPIIPMNMETAWTMAGKFALSGMLPKSYNGEPEEKIAKAFTAMQLGAEVGMSPMQSIQNIAVINGQPSLWGDAQKALVLGSGLCEYIKETVHGEPEDEDFRAECIVKREGQDEVTEIFTKQDAIRAGLWGRSVWKPYPKRMIKYRARAFALRDVFPDVLKGLRHTAEELNTSTIDVTPEKATNERTETDDINNILQKGINTKETPEQAEDEKEPASDEGAGRDEDSVSTDGPADIGVVLGAQDNTEPETSSTTESEDTHEALAEDEPESDPAKNKAEQIMFDLEACNGDVKKINEIFNEELDHIFVLPEELQDPIHDFMKNFKE